MLPSLELDESRIIVADSLGAIAFLGQKQLAVNLELFDAIEQVNYPLRACPLGRQYEKIGPMIHFLTSSQDYPGTGDIWWVGLCPS